MTVSEEILSHAIFAQHHSLVKGMYISPFLAKENDLESSIKVIKQNNNLGLHYHTLKIRVVPFKKLG